MAPALSALSTATGEHVCTAAR